MKKLVFVFVLVFCLISSSTSFAKSNEQFHYQFERMGNEELTNADLNNPKLYVFISGLLLTSSPKDVQRDNIPLWSLSYPKIPGVDYKDYDIVNYYPYNPNKLDFSDNNIWRLVSPSTKTQNDFDRIMYRPEGVETGQDVYIFEGDGELRGGVSYQLDKSQATLDLNKYMKLPGAEKSLAEKYQWSDYQIEEFRNYFYGIIPDEEHYTDRHLFTYSMVIELEKKEIEVEEKVVKPSVEDKFGYAGLWTSSSDPNGYWELEIDVSKKLENKYFVALNYIGGTQGGVASSGYIELKKGKQYLSKHAEWEYYEDGNYPTFYIDLQDHKVIITADNPFSTILGDKIIYDQHDPNPDYGFDWDGWEQYHTGN